jgi:hypothetical protein
MSDQPADLSDVVQRRQEAYDADPTPANERRLQVAQAQLARAPRAIVGVNNDDVDLDAVVARRREAVEQDPSPENQRRLQVAEAQLAQE